MSKDLIKSRKEIQEIGVVNYAKTHEDDIKAVAEAIQSAAENGQEEVCYDYVLNGFLVALLKEKDYKVSVDYVFKTTRIFLYN